MPPFAFRRDRETRVSQRERFTVALGTNQNGRDRTQGRADCHKHSQNSPNVAGGLDGANLANGRANLRGAAVFFKTKTMNIQDYHNMTDRISKSGLDKIHRSPAHFKTPQKETDAMRIGRIVHEYILEGVKNFVTSPFDSFRTKEAREWRDSQTLPIITADEVERIYAMDWAVHWHETAGNLFGYGAAEQTILFEEPTTGAACRCRLDYITKDNDILDLKTTDDASPAAFARSVRKYRYDVQAAFYLDGVEYATGIRPEHFYFIAVEKSAPFGVAVYELSEGMIEEARLTYLEDLKTWQTCMERDEWPAYSDEIIELV